jgi:predicted ATPase/class 3 adenylate cyclase
MPLLDGDVSCQEPSPDHTSIVGSGDVLRCPVQYLLHVFCDTPRKGGAENAIVYYCRVENQIAVSVGKLHPARRQQLEGPSMQDLPRGTVTFLFTDIEGSTRLWHDHPDTMPDAYDRHNAILRAAIYAHGGVVFKTIGDAFQAALPNATAGVNAALASQRALHAEPWPLPDPLTVRMALHTGAVDPDAQGDYRSPVLNRLGRLLSAGHGGQVLLSQATVELARDGLHADATLIDLGEQRLKDLYRPERVYQLGGVGLPAEFPPLVTVDARPNNLPTQLTQFIGRTDDLSALLEMLHREDIRLVTLTGTGGMGKTRLALQIGADALDAFKDGVFVAQLDPVTNPAMVPTAIAQALGLREDREVPAPTAVTNYLRDRDLLLILDNFEQVVEASPFVGELLVACPGLKVLATSRIRLQVRGEQEYPVRPLRLPDPRRHVDAQSVTQYESVRLFDERALSVKPTFEVTDANAPAIAEICTRLDGLPLAIELAAARVRMLPPEAMLRRLTTRLPLLTGGARDLPLRQQTLRGAIAWSYEMLSEEDQALFRRMAVFAGGASLEAIEAVAAGQGPAWDAFDGLERLVDQSLVRQSELTGEPRFSMFETIREFGLEELEQHAEANEAHGTHAAWYADLAKTVGSATESEELVAALDRVEMEVGNIRAACGWTLGHDIALGYRLLTGLAEYWSWRHPSHSDKAWVQQVLARDAVNVDERVRMNALLAGGAIRTAVFDSVEDKDRAWRRCEESLRMAEALGENEHICLTYAQMGVIALMQGDTCRSTDLFERGVSMARATKDAVGLYRCLNNAGFSAYLSGDLQRSRAYLDEALVVARSRGPIHAVTPLNSVADLSRAEGDLMQAEGLYREATVIALDCKLFMDVSVNLMGLVITAAATGRWERAAWIAGAVASLRNTGDVYVEREYDLRALNSDYDRAVARTRESIGRDVFTREWSAGAATSIEDAVERATSMAIRVVT